MTLPRGSISSSNVTGSRTTGAPAGSRPSRHISIWSPRQTDTLLLRELIAVEIEWRRKRGEHAGTKRVSSSLPRSTLLLVDAAFAEDPSVRRPADGEDLSPQRSQRDTACDLLFGILALQNSFIDRAALLVGLQRLDRRQDKTARAAFSSIRASSTAAAMRF